MQGADEVTQQALVGRRDDALHLPSTAQRCSDHAGLLGAACLPPVFCLSAHAAQKLSRRACHPSSAGKRCTMHTKTALACMPAQASPPCWARTWPLPACRGTPAAPRAQPVGPQPSPLPPRCPPHPMAKGRRRWQRRASPGCRQGWGPLGPGQPPAACRCSATPPAPCPRRPPAQQPA